MIKLEQVRSEVLERFERIDRRFAASDQRLARIDQRTAELSDRVEIVLAALREAVVLAVPREAEDRAPDDDARSTRGTVTRLSVIAEPSQGENG